MTQIHTYIHRTVLKVLSFFIFSSKKRKEFRKRYSDFSITEFIRYKKMDYKIIPLGFNCYPRVIATYAGLKPRKMYGELSCPFDNVLCSSFGDVLNCLERNFEHYFDDIQMGEDNFYFNNIYKIRYLHDSFLSKDELVNRYKKRIKNFSKYLKSKKHIYFLFNGLKRDTVDFERLLAVLKKLRKDNFSIIFLDQNNASAPSEKLNNNIYIIHEYEKLTTPDWVGELFAGKYPAAESNVQKLKAIIK